MWCLGDEASASHPSLGVVDWWRAGGRALCGPHLCGLLLPGVSSPKRRSPPAAGCFGGKQDLAFHVLRLRACIRGEDAAFSGSWLCGSRAGSLGHRPGIAQQRFFLSLSLPLALFGWARRSHPCIPLNHSCPILAWPSPSRSTPCTQWRLLRLVRRCWHLAARRRLRRCWDVPSARPPPSPPCGGRLGNMAPLLRARGRWARPCRQRRSQRARAVA